MIQLNKVKKGINSKNCVVFFDFDNTITTFDILDDMLGRFSVNESWRRLEADWKEDKIGSYDCLVGQVAGLRISGRNLNNYLSSVKLDPHFKPLMKFFHEKRIKVVILSDNFDYILKKVLSQNRVRNLKLYCNRIRSRGDKLIPSFPFRNKRCLVCAHCKTKNLLAKSQGKSIIFYIGDGNSDICPAGLADIVFAKGELLTYFQNRKYACLPYKDLKDINTFFRGILR